jgi:hypothetical protein
LATRVDADRPETQYNRRPSTRCGRQLRLARRPGIPPGGSARARRPPPSGRGREGSDHREAGELTARSTGGTRHWSSADPGLEIGDRQPAGDQIPVHAGDPGQICAGGSDDVDPAVGVIHPVDRHLVDAQAHSLGEPAELGVEEPPVILDQRQPTLSDGPDGLEAALRIRRRRRARGAAGVIRA